MTEILEAIIQGIIQGLTEFLPVSSSGHLAVYQHFFGSSAENGLFFSAILHLGTLFAVVLAFRDTFAALIVEFFRMLKDIFTGKFSWKNMNGDRRMIVMLIISLAVLIPLYPLKDLVESVANDHIVVIGFCFLYTAVILYLSDCCTKGHREKEDITVKNALTVGIFQGIALFPGISRSGSTIVGGLFSGFTRETAVKYSFVLGTPTILAGCLLEVKDAVAEGMDVNLLALAVGFVVAALVGLAAIWMVRWIVNNNKFIIFSVYTLILGLVVIAASLSEMGWVHIG